LVGRSPMDVSAPAARLPKARRSRLGGFSGRSRLVPIHRFRPHRVLPLTLDKQDTSGFDGRESLPTIRGGNRAYKSSLPGVLDLYARISSATGIHHNPRRRARLAAIPAVHTSMAVTPAARSSREPAHVSFIVPCAHLTPRSTCMRGEELTPPSHTAQGPPTAIAADERPLRPPVAIAAEERPLRPPAAIAADERPLRPPAAIAAEERPLRPPAAGEVVCGSKEAGKGSSMALGVPAPFEEVLKAALPGGTVGGLQQQADASMMLLRAEWKAVGVLDSVQARCHGTLHFIARLAEVASEVGALKGTLFQALIARHNAELQRTREEEERRREQEEMALLDAALAEEGAANVTDAFIPVPPFEVASGTRSFEEPLPLHPCLQALDAALVDGLVAAAAELRALLRIKVEDDQDLLTAQRALAECGYFLLLLRDEARKRELSEADLLRKCELGEAEDFP